MRQERRKPKEHKLGRERAGQGLGARTGEGAAPPPRPAPPPARNSGRAAPPGGCTWLALSEGLPRPCSALDQSCQVPPALGLVMLPSWSVPRGVVGRGVKFPQAPSWIPGSTLSLVPDADPGPSPSGQLEATWHKTLVSTGDPHETQEKGVPGKRNFKLSPGAWSPAYGGSTTLSWNPPGAAAGAEGRGQGGGGVRPHHRASGWTRLKVRLGESWGRGPAEGPVATPSSVPELRLGWNPGDEGRGRVKGRT